MKSFKKTLAALLAALMVVCSMPFTALAVEDVEGQVTISLEAYDFQCGLNSPPTWGPYLESGEGEGDPYGADETISAGTYFALAFIAHDVVDIGIQQMQIRGWYDDKKIAGAYVTSRQQGKNTTYTFNNDTVGAHSEETWVFGMEYHDNDSVLYSESDAYTMEDGMSFFGSTPSEALTAAEAYGWPLGNGVGVQELCLSKTNGFTGAPLINTTFEYMYNTDAPEDWDGQVVFDEVLVGVTGVYAREDITVNELYEIFHFNPSNHSDNQWVAEDANSRHEVVVAPYENDVPQPEQVVYHTVKGEDITQAKDADAPSNTEVNEGEHTSDSAGQHLDHYVWVADVTETYDFVEEGVYVPCSMSEYTGEIPGSCTQKAVTAAQKCDVCDYVTGGVEGDYDYSFAGHNYVKSTVPSTCTVQGYDEYVCQNCGDGTQNHSYKDNYQNTISHNFSVFVSATEGDCVTPIETTYKCSYGCETTDVQTGEVNSNIHKNVVTDDAEEATCAKDGKTAGSHCEACSTVITPQETISKETIAHTYNYEGEYRTVLAPTKKDDGIKEYTCTVCKVATETAPIEALGVIITVNTSELGTATLTSTTNDNVDTTNKETKVKYGDGYTLVATPGQNAKFVGWMLNGKMLTDTDGTYESVAYADTTYTAVFVEDDDIPEFTVTFMDNYGNVIDTKSGNELASLEAMPTPPQLAGYKFVEWDMQLEDVKALKTSTVVTAIYESDDELTYTVIANGCTIDVNGVQTEDAAYDVAYNSRVTVTPKSGTAASWTANGAVAAYGESYTFYCGSNITLTYSESPVTPVPTVADVKAEKTATHVVAFLATRSVVDGYTLIESGFVYGKAMAKEDLILDNVGLVKGTDNGQVKYVACQNIANDGQFSLNYGVTAMNQNACARAYLIYRDNSTSETTVIYSDGVIYQY